MLRAFLKHPLFKTKTKGGELLSWLF